MPHDSEEDLGRELKDFEKDLAHLVAKFLRLYDRLEHGIRPEARRPPTRARALLVRTSEAPLLPGYQ